ncbi:hypothetical protein D3C81_1624460 [compost metagenome]
MSDCVQRAWLSLSLSAVTVEVVTYLVLLPSTGAADCWLTYTRPLAATTGLPTKPRGEVGPSQVQRRVKRLLSRVTGTRPVCAALPFTPSQSPAPDKACSAPMLPASGATVTL